MLNRESPGFSRGECQLPVAALDKIFARGPVEIESAQVVKTSLARAASDHLPVVVDFSLRAVPA